MFIHNQIIDSVQSGKKQMVQMLVPNAAIKEELIKLIDAQAQAAKASVNASVAIAHAFIKNTGLAMEKIVPSKS